jgi:hypothetical protein
MPSTPMLPLVSTNLLHDSIDKQRVHSDQGAYMLAAIFVRDDTLQNLEIWSHSSSQLFQFPLFLQFCFPLCCAGSI